MSVAGGQSQLLLEVGHVSGWWTKSTFVRGWSCSVAGGQSQHWLEVGHVSGWWTKSTFVRGWSCQWLVDKVNFC